MTYGAIYADPPWKFETYAESGITERSADSKYETASVRYLGGLNVDTLAAPNCALFMWVVDSHLEQGIGLMRAWGFTYKTIAFIWVKPNIGMGYWTRKMAEICLFGTRGSPKRLSRGVRQVVMAPRREHSRKPEEVYDRIEALVGGPYCEMFARQRRPGWGVEFSNEADKFKELVNGN